MQGFVTLARLCDASGRPISNQAAVDRGIIKPATWQKPVGWHIPREEVPLNWNTSMDNLRQYLAYLFGGRTPSASFICSRFGLGTGTKPVAVTDTDLDNPLDFYYNGASYEKTKPVDGVDYLAFIARVVFTIGASEANGNLLTEMGLYAQDQDTLDVILLARTVSTGQPKDANWSPTLHWYIRF